MNPHLVVLSTLLLLTVATRAEEPVGASADTEGESGVHALSASASVPETAFTNTGSDIPPGLGLDVEPEAAPGALPIERLTWHKLPLQITLPVGQERLVSFPVAVRAGLPPTLTPDVLRTQILNDGTIYWTALKPFGPQRVRIEALGTGNTYLLDLSASDRIADTRPIEVSIPEGKPSAAPVDAAATDVAENRSAGTDYVTLTRVAAQHLYAPERLLNVRGRDPRSPNAPGRLARLHLPTREALPQRRRTGRDGRLSRVQPAVRGRARWAAISSCRFSARSHWCSRSSRDSARAAKRRRQPSPSFRSPRCRRHPRRMPILRRTPSAR
ncbi:hypothetical protein JOD69_004135 [Methylocaldum sp. RMAD-M]|nr:hypothetical protein [Methylocaldum sp. RMAD-M]